MKVVRDRWILSSGRARLRRARLRRGLLCHNCCSRLWMSSICGTAMSRKLSCIAGLRWTCAIPPPPLRTETTCPVCAALLITASIRLSSGVRVFRFSKTSRFVLEIHLFILECWSMSWTFCFVDWRSNFTVDQHLVRVAALRLLLPVRINSVGDPHFARKSNHTGTGSQPRSRTVHRKDDTFYRSLTAPQSRPVRVRSLKGHHSPLFR